MRIALIIAGLLIPLAAQGQEIYRWVDKDGIVHYADHPGAPGAERIPYRTLGAGGEAADSGPGAAPSEPAASTAPPGPTYQSLRIISPTADQVFFGGGVTVPVQVELDRDLRSGDHLLVFVDGKRVADVEGLSTTLTGLDRGTHFLRTAVVDDAGSVVITSQQLTFYVRQPSVAKPPTGPNVKLPRPAVKRPGTAG